MRTCPKCSYIRKPADDAPAWQCPRCGIAYDKYLASPSLAQRTREREDREARAARNQRSSGPLPWLFLLLAAGSAGWWGYSQWRAAHPTAAQRAAEAQARSRLAGISAAGQQLAVAEDLKRAEEHLRMARPQQGMDILQRRANEGHPHAMTALAVAYQGYGHAPRDPAKSREWMERAAREGSTLAMVHLGYASETGRGAPQSWEEAVNQYRKAARAGDASALYALGLVYAKGVPGRPAEPVFGHMLLDLATRAYEKDPQFDDFAVQAKAPHSARYEVTQLEKTMPPTDIVRAKELADAWQPGLPFPFN